MKLRRDGLSWKTDDASASLHFPKNIVPNIVKTASNQFRYGAESDATYAGWVTDYGD